MVHDLLPYHVALLIVVLLLAAVQAIAVIQK